MDARFPYSPAEVAKVHVVQFGILSPDEIVISPPSNPLPVPASAAVYLLRVESSGQASMALMCSLMSCC
jgi:hypothetical protein